MGIERPGNLTGGVAWAIGVDPGGGACAVGGGSFKVWLHGWVGSKLVVGNNWGLAIEKNWDGRVHSFNQYFFFKKKKNFLWGSSWGYRMGQKPRPSE